MIPVNRDHQALTPSCFAVADRLPYPKSAQHQPGYRPPRGCGLLGIGAMCAAMLRLPLINHAG